jgi:hypothetical protein
LLLAGTLALGGDNTKLAPYAQSKSGPTKSNMYFPIAVRAYEQWQYGLPKSETYFPIAVWLQDPSWAPGYQQAGINLYLGLWQGPTEDQLTQLAQYGMPVICDQNDVGLAHLMDPTIVGWTIDPDEPDNAQELPSGDGYGPPVLPSTILAEYEQLCAADPTRPVFLNLGQGVAWDGYIGRGTRTGHDEDYPLYCEGCDVASFDIYPVADDDPAVNGQLYLVGQGVERLVTYSGGTKPVWNCIECTDINGTGKATPQEIRAEVWMSLVNGSRGLIYFVHQFLPTFDDHALLDDPVNLAAVTAINHQIMQLAPVLNSPTVLGALTVESSNASVPVAAMVKKCRGRTYVFAVATQPGVTDVTFTLAGLRRYAQIEVLGEGRIVSATVGTFRDQFNEWDVHLYQVK